MDRYPNKRVVGRDQLPSLEHADIHTLGGNTNQDATYHALHIRRGDPPGPIPIHQPTISTLYIHRYLSTLPSDFSPYFSS